MAHSLKPRRERSIRLEHKLFVYQTVRAYAEFASGGGRRQPKCGGFCQRRMSESDSPRTASRAIAENHERVALESDLTFRSEPSHEVQPPADGISLPKMKSSDALSNKEDAQKSIDLILPNQSRSLIRTRDPVQFWGYRSFRLNARSL